jgi:hypothetical protein
MNGLYLFTLLAVAVFGQNISKVILWEDHSQGDPEFSMRSQVQMKKKLQEMGSFEFVEDDVLRNLAEERLLSWPLQTNALQDSLAQTLAVTYQMTLQTRDYRAQLRRSSFYIIAEELVSYQLDFKVKEAGAIVYQAEINVDTIIGHGWCGWMDCKISQRDSMEEIKIKTHLLNKGIQLLIIDAQPFFKEE